MAEAEAKSEGKVPTFLQLAPAVLFVMWNLAFIIIGWWATDRDWSLKDKNCGKSTHVLKYCLLNIVFVFLSTASYLVFPGGGEGARARAVVLIAFHFAFLVWGTFMRSDLTDECRTEFSDQFQGINLFQLLCCIHNGFFGALFAVHECCIGHWIKSDFTLVPEKGRREHSYQPLSGNPLKDSGLGSPAPALAPSYSMHSQPQQSHSPEQNMMDSGMEDHFRNIAPASASPYTAADP